MPDLDPDGAAEWVRTLFTLVTGSLSLDSDTFRAVAGSPQLRWAAVAIAVLSGISELVGQSVALFLNRVRPPWFLVSIAVAGLISLVEILLWTVGAWLVVQVSGHPATLYALIGLITLAQAPYVFGFLGLLPYYGPGLLRVLGLWALLCAGVGLRAIDLAWPAIAAALVGGFAFRQLAGLVMGRFVEGLDDWVWRTTTGTRRRLRVRDAVAVVHARAVRDAQRWTAK